MHKRAHPHTLSRSEFPPARFYKKYNCPFTYPGSSRPFRYLPFLLCGQLFHQSLKPLHAAVTHLAHHPASDYDEPVIPDNETKGPPSHAPRARYSHLSMPAELPPTLPQSFSESCPARHAATLPHKKHGDQTFCVTLWSR